jgi:uncharacterized protein (DUF1800 family)
LVFDPARHDYGDKQFLGYSIKGGGWQEVERALDILAQSPVTARHISFQLAQFFVADQPDPALVDAMARAWVKSGGDLAVVLQAMLESPLFWDANAIGHKFKTPFEYAVSALRAANVTPQDPRPVLEFLRALGQPLYGIETPDGYKQVEQAWLNPDAMARRLSFATALGNGRLGEQRFDIDAESLRGALPLHLSARTEGALNETAPQMRSALLLGSPEFLYR